MFEVGIPRCIKKSRHKSALRRHWIGAGTAGVLALAASLALPAVGHAIPADAVYVSGSTGSDSAPGTESSPMRTIAAGIRKAATGKTVVVRAGTYNEQLLIDRTMTLEGYPGESVWLDGSVPVGGWSASGSTWVVPWSIRFDHSTSYSRGDTSTWFLDPAHPMAAWPDQVFIDGSALHQVGSASQVGPGTFYADYSAARLRIGTSPSGHQVRASNRTQALYVTAPNVTLQGLGVRRYATPIPDNGAVRMGSSGGVVRNMTIVDNATIGLSLRNNNITVDHVTVQRNGMLGIGGNAVYGLRLTNSVVQDNNVERFKPAPVSGGVKITRSRGVVVSGNDVSGNAGTGIWFDESCYGITVARNVANNNAAAGIEVELSDTAIIASNRTTGNKVVGILLFDSGNVRLFNNEMGGNGVFGVQLSQDERRNSNTSLTGHDPALPNPDPTVPWLVRNVVLSNNVFGSGGLFQFYVLDKRTRIPADSMNITINGNLFNRWTGTGQAKMVAWGGGDNVTLTYFNSPDALAQAKNGGWRNAAVDPIALGSMGPAMSASVAVAVGLPSDIAAALGQPVGARKLGRF